ncbi:MAG: hypothetical protein ACLFVU_03675 [Phycisphaerae bacterium]
MSNGELEQRETRSPVKLYLLFLAVLIATGIELLLWGGYAASLQQRAGRAEEGFTWLVRAGVMVAALSWVIGALGYWLTRRSGAKAIWAAVVLLALVSIAHFLGSMLIRMEYLQ